MFGQVWSEGDRVGGSFAPRTRVSDSRGSTMLVTSVRVMEAHSVRFPPTRLETQWPSSDDEPLLTVDPFATSFRREAMRAKLTTILVTTVSSVTGMRSTQRGTW